MPHAAALSVDVQAPAGVVFAPPTVASATAAALSTGGAGIPGAADLRLAQLLCARLCHDLIGAAGAIETGVDLLAEESADRADICDLIGLSGRQLNRRLAFYRLAFGMTGQAGDSRPLAEAKRLAEGLVEGGRVTLRWRPDGAAARQASLGGNEIRLLLCAMLVAAEGLRRGGSLTVRLDRGAAGTELAIEGHGRDAAIAEATAAALAGSVGLDAITARTVPAYYLGLQARALAAQLDVQERADGFSLRITVPC